MFINLIKKSPSIQSSGDNLKITQELKHTAKVFNRVDESYAVMKAERMRRAVVTEEETVVFNK